MSEQSFIFDFARSPSFFEKFNIAFNISDMNKSKTAANPLMNFKLVLASYCPDNILDCIDANGLLNEEVTIGKDSNGNDLITTIGLDWLVDDYGDGTIELHDEAQFNIGDIDVPLKAVFLTSSSGYVIGYSINMVSIPVTNKVIFDDDVIFWDISRFNQL